MSETLRCAFCDDLAESIAHFLYWSSWLDLHDAGLIEEIFVRHRGRIHHMGTRTFDHLYATLNEAYPEWRTWNPNYINKTVDVERRGE